MVKPFMLYRGIGLALILGLCMGVGNAAAQKKAAKVKKLRIIVEETAIRKYPSDMYKAIGTAKKGDSFAYTGLTQSGWYQIHYQGDLAYVKAEHAKPVKVTLPSKTAETPKAVASKEAPALTEESATPMVPEEKKGLPVFWIVVTAVVILLYILYFIRNLRQQREFEEYLRHKPS
ncbi:MAG: hypothetical protein Q9P90_01480 [candidate division KSB1 bacterium]|nr:hypothetical protein [candidate division KSB1 bacterium]